MYVYINKNKFIIEEIVVYVPKYTDTASLTYYYLALFMLIQLSFPTFLFCHQATGSVDYRMEKLPLHLQ